MYIHLEAWGNPQRNKALCFPAVPESLIACPWKERERLEKSNSRLACKIAEKKGEKKLHTDTQNGRSTMPERQTTDGQTELESKCQGLEESVAAWDIIREIAKQSHVANVSDTCKGEAQGGRTSPEVHAPD